MTRFLMTAVFAATVALGGCVFPYSEEPLGSKPVALEPEMGGVWALYARNGGRYGPAEDRGGPPVIFLDVLGDGTGTVRWLVEGGMFSWDLTLRQHNDVTFANLRLRGHPRVVSGHDDDPWLMIDRFYPLAIERLSESEYRLRFFFPLYIFREHGGERAAALAEQARLPLKPVVFNPLGTRFGPEDPGEGGTVWVLGRLTNAQLDAITAPELFAASFPKFCPGNVESECILRKIPWPPPVAPAAE